MTRQQFPVEKAGGSLLCEGRKSIAIPYGTINPRMHWDTPQDLIPVTRTISPIHG